MNRLSPGMHLARLTSQDDRADSKRLFARAFEAIPISNHINAVASCVCSISDEDAPRRIRPVQDQTGWPLFPPSNEHVRGVLLPVGQLGDRLQQSVRSQGGARETLQVSFSQRMQGQFRVRLAPPWRTNYVGLWWPNFTGSRISQKRRSWAFHLFRISAVAAVTNVARHTPSLLDFQQPC